jgi:hypothetical protein
MILFENAGGAPWRRGEFTPFPGVRTRVRALPYQGYEPPGVDPWSGEYRRQARAGEEERILVSSDSAMEWSNSLRSAPPGPIALGPAPAAEAVYGAAAAAVRGARSLGRGIVAVDVPSGGLPVGEDGAPDDDLIAIAVWRQGREQNLWEEGRAFAGRARWGVAFPLLPGWTDEPSFLRHFIIRCREEGARFVVPIETAGSGPSRAAIHADFSALNPDRNESYFQKIHHGDWRDAIEIARSRFLEAAAEAGLPSRVPQPRGASLFEANRRAIEALEEEAERSAEPHASRLRRAVRIVEELGRDLESLSRDGNARLVFSPDSPEWRIIAHALGEPSGGAR